MRLTNVAAVVLVCAAGALAAALVQLFVQYVAFSGQMLELQWTGALVVPEALSAPGWLGVPFGGQTPSVTSLLVLALVALLVQLGCLVLAVRVYRTTRRSHAEAAPLPRSRARVIAISCVTLAVSVSALIASLAPALWSIERAYWLVRVMAAEHQPDLTLARKAAVLRESLGYAFHVFIIAVGSLGAQLTLLLASVAVAGLTLATKRSSHAARDRESLRKAPQPEAWQHLPTLRALLFGLCWLMPVLGALVHSARLRAAVQAGGTRMTERARAAHILAEVAQSRSWLEVAGGGAIWAIAFSTVSLAVLVVLPGRAGNRPGAPRSLSPHQSLPKLATALALAALTVVVLRATEPYAAENREPLVAEPIGVVVLPGDSPALPLAGPDRLEPAPVLALTPGHAQLNDRAINLAALPGDLATLERRWTELHPGHTFAGRLSVLCGAGTDLREVIPLLQAASNVRYTRLQFVFGGWQVVNRTVLGWLREPHFSAANAELVAQQSARSHDPRTTTIELAAGESCDILTTKLVAQRRRGRTVRLSIATRRAPVEQPR